VDELVSPAGATLSVRERVLAVLEGRKPDRHPFCDRLELWYTALLRQERMPPEYVGLSLLDVHKRVGIGQLKFVVPHEFRLHGVEMVVFHDGEEAYRETDPVTTRFPVMEDLVPLDRPCHAAFQLRTPVGSIQVAMQVVEEAFRWGQAPYLEEHPIKGPEDFKTVHWILDHLELAPRHEDVRETVDAIGDAGFVAVRLERIPFQEVLLDYLGELPTFYALADDPAPLHGLMQAIQELRVETARLLEGLDYPYVEMLDNLSGQMTSPRLFTQYALPQYQATAELYHAQGKLLGSHTDGELKPLLGLLGETGLDVCESFSPTPLTSCTFDEAWDALGGDRPLIWGAIPSPLLEERADESELEAYIDHVLDRVGGAPIILGIADMVLGNNLIERVRYVADRIEAHAL
jgi:hypothetical protein